MTDIDTQLLNRELDRVKSKVFLGSNAAFLGPLMCTLAFSWVTGIATACTNGVFLYWNPVWFLSLPQATRLTVLLHELWHVALLHMIRRGNRHPKVWNWACDIFINNMLYRLGFTFDGSFPWINDSYNRWKHPDWQPIGDYPENMPAEQIYDELMKLFQSTPPEDMPCWGFEGTDNQTDEGDIIEPEDIGSMGHTITNKVVTAVTAAKLSGMPGDIPGDLESILDKFLNPKLPWNQLFQGFFNDLHEEDYTLSRPDRRYQDIYLPSLEPSEGGLEHVMWFQDVSGSVVDDEIARLCTEFKYVKETYNPKKITLVLFDTKIQKITEYNEEDEFDKIHVIGRGGTSFICVREFMIEHQPTAVVIFSDMDCKPMEPLPNGMDIPTIWIGVNAESDIQVPFGKLIHIRE